jgi:hypothetical protein
VLQLEFAATTQGISLRLVESLATESGTAGNGCYFYSALMSELLRVTGGFEGATVHEQCRARGDDVCRWRTTEAERLD